VGPRLRRHPLALDAQVRFVLRWPKKYRLVDATGQARLAWHLARGKRAWGARALWDGRRHCWRKVSVLAVPVTHPVLAPLRTWLLRHGCHRTGRHCREAEAPLYRLRAALAHLWRATQPATAPPWRAADQRGSSGYMMWPLDPRASSQGDGPLPAAYLPTPGWLMACGSSTDGGGRRCSVTLRLQSLAQGPCDALLPAHT
jgi:hypothetical protein